MEERRDVIIRAPAAVWPPPKLSGTEQISPQETIQMQEATIRHLERELERQKLVASTIAATTCCLIKAIADGTGVGVSDEGAIQIPREMYSRLKGAELQIANHERNSIEPVYCRFMEKPADSITKE